MIDNIKRIKEEATGRITSAPDVEELERLRVHYLGKKGLLTSLLHQLKSLTPEQRKEMGAVLNEVKTEFETTITTRQQQLDDQRINQEIEKSPMLDVTLPGQFVSEPGSIHPVTRVTEEVIEHLKRVGFSLASGPEIELDAYNFEALNMPAHHPARDMQDTFYIGGPVLLRTHTSPVQIRTMKNRKPPLQIISHGKVYRSDYDQTHTPMFHQMEGLMVDENISLADLKGVVNHLVKALFGSKPVRFRPSYFPFTEPSAEIDVHFGNLGWLEIGGCGMVHPKVFEAVGYDYEKYSGFAFGLGIERIAMLKYGITDLRSFFENDLRMLEQF